MAAGAPCSAILSAATLSQVDQPSCRWRDRRTLVLAFVAANFSTASSIALLGGVIRRANDEASPPAQAQQVPLTLPPALAPEPLLISGPAVVPACLPEFALTADVPAVDAGWLKLPLAVTWALEEWGTGQSAPVRLSLGSSPRSVLVVKEAGFTGAFTVRATVTVLGGTRSPLLRIYSTALIILISCGKRRLFICVQ